MCVPATRYLMQKGNFYLKKQWQIVPEADSCFTVGIILRSDLHTDYLFRGST